MDDQAFYYAMGVQINDRATKFTYGTIEAQNEYKAMDLLDKRAKEEHSGPMVELRLHKVDKTTGERDPEPVIIMGNIMGKEYESKTAERSTKTSQACEEKQPASEGVPQFGDGWGTKLPNPSPPVSLKHKETHHG